MKNMDRRPVVVPLPVIFEAHHDHVVGIIKLGNSTIGLRFESPEHIVKFAVELLEKAKEVWPDNELIKEYLSDD